MGLKKYIVGSILLLILIFAYTFSIEAGDYRVQILDYTLILPVAIWVILPMALLLIMSVLHIIFYGLKNYFSLKAVKKDTASLVTLINKRLLNENSTINFQNKNFKDIASILAQLDLEITNSNFSSENKEITKVIDQIFAINSGKYVSSKELKLDNNNPIMIKNLTNRIDSDDNFALEVLKSSDKYPQNLIKHAFLKVLDSKPMATINNILTSIKLDNEMAISLFKKDSEQKIEDSMTNTQILKIMSEIEFTNNELITIANSYKTSMTPDQIIKLYEDLSVENEEYTTAYLYVLSEYEMIDKMRDILVNSSTHEFIPFKALVDLKDAGKHIYSLETLSNIK
jgi:hypothetical protein